MKTAIAMGLHPRLGEESSLKEMNVELLRKIVDLTYPTRSPQAMRRIEALSIRSGPSQIT